MEKLFNNISIAFAIVGSFFATLFGGWDKWMYALIAFIVIDYITGLIKAIYLKQLSSEIGFKGILKKIMILVAVAVAVVLENTTGLPLRNLVVCFYIANEGISLLENIAEFIPIPKKMKEIFLQLRDKTENAESEEK